MSYPRAKSSGLLQKAKNEEKNTNAPKNFTCANTDLQDPSIALIEEYIEKIIKECEFAKKLDSLDIYNCLISTQI